MSIAQAGERERDGAVIEHLLASGEMLPSQLASASSWSPEKRLAAAVLTQALITIRDYAGDPSKRELVQEDLAWLRSDDAEEPYAFRRLCDVFGLEVDWVRENVERWQRATRTARTPFSMHRHAA